MDTLVLAFQLRQVHHQPVHVLRQHMTAKYFHRHTIAFHPPRAVLATLHSHGSGFLVVDHHSTVGLFHRDLVVSAAERHLAFCGCRFGGCGIVRRASRSHWGSRGRRIGSRFFELRPTFPHYQRIDGRISLFMMQRQFEPLGQQRLHHFRHLVFIRAFGHLGENIESVGAHPGVQPIRIPGNLVGFDFVGDADQGHQGRAPDIDPGLVHRHADVSFAGDDRRRIEWSRGFDGRNFKGQRGGRRRRLTERRSCYHQQSSGDSHEGNLQHKNLISIRIRF